jgi:hypothetical protein
VAGMYPRALGTQGMLIEASVMLFLAPWMKGFVERGLQWGIGAVARDEGRTEEYEKAVGKSFEGGRRWIGRFGKVMREGLGGCCCRV